MIPLFFAWYWSSFGMRASCHQQRPLDQCKINLTAKIFDWVRPGSVSGSVYLRRLWLTLLAVAFELCFVSMWDKETRGLHVIWIFLSISFQSNVLLCNWASKSIWPAHFRTWSAIFSQWQILVSIACSETITVWFTGISNKLDQLKRLRVTPV